MTQKIYQVDAFTDRIFSGNPAAVCPLAAWPADRTMQSIALENNLAETAFYVRRGEDYEIRWFTPSVEVDLCGHATLAAAFVLFNHEGHPGDTVRFHSRRSGLLTVKNRHDLLSLDFPVDTYERVTLTAAIIDGFDLAPREAYRGKTDYLLVYDNESDIRTLTPRLANIAKLKGRGVIVTAPGDSSDFVSRFFAPQSGIDEDPVTGSAHTTLTPYWAGRLGKTELTAIQLSPRKGHLRCRLSGDRVEIDGECRLYMSGKLHL